MLMQPRQARKSLADCTFFRDNKCRNIHNSQGPRLAPIMTVPKMSQLRPGVGVNIVLKADQRSGKLTSGSISEVNFANSGQEDFLQEQKAPDTLSSCFIARLRLKKKVADS